MSQAGFEIIRTRQFDRKAGKLWAERELAEVFKNLAQSPKAGTHLGGEIYKVRVAASGRGKRGGAGSSIYSSRRNEQCTC